MPRLPKLFDKGSWRRLRYLLMGLAVVLAGIYIWQPLRYDLIERRPEKPLPRIPIESTGLYEKGKRVLIVTAHPDDEAFYLGGTLHKLKASGAETTLIVLTDGDKGYYPFFDSESLAKTRQRETRAAAAQVEIHDVVFLRYPDGRLSFEQEAIGKVAAEIKRRNPDIIIAYEPEYWPRVGHRDHRVGGEIARAAMKRTGFQGWSLYFHTLAPNTFADVGRDWADAQNLLTVHASQFHGDRLKLIRGIVASHAQDAGARFGTDFAEEFRATHGKP